MSRKSKNASTGKKVPVLKRNVRKVAPKKRTSNKHRLSKTVEKRG